LTDSADSAPELQSSEASPTASGVELNSETDFSHGVTAEYQIACCKKDSDGLVDCLCCLEAELSTFLTGLDPADRALVRRVWTAVREATTKGVSKDQLFVCVQSHRLRTVLNPSTYNLG